MALVGKTYQHYRNKNYYLAIYKAIETDTKQTVVVYKSVSPPYQVYVRTESIFDEIVRTEDGTLVKRYQIVD